MTQSMDWFGGVVLALALSGLGVALDGDSKTDERHDHGNEQALFDGRGTEADFGCGQESGRTSGPAGPQLDAPAD